MNFLEENFFSFSFLFYFYQACKKEREEKEREKRKRNSSSLPKLTPSVTIIIEKLSSAFPLLQQLKTGLQGMMLSSSSLFFLSFCLVLCFLLNFMNTVYNDSFLVSWPGTRLARERETSPFTHSWKERNHETENSDFHCHLNHFLSFYLSLTFLRNVFFFLTFLSLSFQGEGYPKMSMA